MRRSRNPEGGALSSPFGLHQLLLRTAQRRPDSLALTAGKRRLRYAELAREASALARWFVAAGVQRGDRVLVLASNRVESVVAFWATLMCGGVAVLVHPGTRQDKLVWLLTDSGATVLIAGDSMADVFVPAAERAPGLRHVLVVGQPPVALARAVPFAQATSADTDCAPELPAPRAEDLAALIYTSGSTGEPKAVMLTHRNMLAAAHAITRYLGLREDDVVLAALPLSFDYGLYQLILSAGVGARVVLERSFELPGQVLNRMVAERVTVLPAVPTVFAMLARLGDLGRWDLSSVRLVTSTAAALGPEQIRWLTRTFPRSQVFSMYGLTECKRCTYLPPADLARKPGSVGISIPGTEIWLVDAHDRVLGPGAVGQLVVRGATVMAGYWRRPEETAQCLRPGPNPDERVLYTGDLCRMDEDGYLYFVRRMDDVLKSRGEKVAPAEVEAALHGVPDVLQAVVVGVPDALLGDAIKAYVVLAPGATATPSELIAACRRKLEPFMVPRQVVLVPELPCTRNGKIEKAALV